MAIFKELLKPEILGQWIICQTRSPCSFFFGIYEQHFAGRTPEHQKFKNQNDTLYNSKKKVFCISCSHFKSGIKFYTNLILKRAFMDQNIQYVSKNSLIEYTITQGGIAQICHRFEYGLPKLDPQFLNMSSQSFSDKVNVLP